MAHAYNEQGFNKIIWYISLIGFLGIFSTTISKTPVLPLFVNSLGGSVSLLGIIAAASPLAGIMFSFPVGFLADHIGKKKVLILSSFIFAIAPLLYLLVTNPLFLIPIRFFHGMATAIMGPTASAIIISLFDKNKGEKLGTYSAATLYGRTLAPLLGGFLISYFAYFGNLTSFRFVYIVAFLLALPIIPFSFMLPRDNKTTRLIKVNFGDMLIAFKEFVSKGVLISTALIEMSTYFIYGVLEAYLPLFLVSHRIQAGLIGILFSVQVLSIALTKPFFGKLADKVDKRYQILTGIFILSLTTFFMYHFTNYLLALINILFFGIGMSLSTVATSTYIAENESKDKQGTALGILSALMDVGQSFGPFMIGIIIGRFSYQIGFYVSSFVALLSAVFFYTKTFLPVSKKLTSSI